MGRRWGGRGGCFLDFLFCFCFLCGLFVLKGERGKEHEVGWVRRIWEGLGKGKNIIKMHHMKKNIQLEKMSIGKPVQHFLN